MPSGPITYGSFDLCGAVVGAKAVIMILEYAVLVALTLRLALLKNA
jgi:hypothetical protein